MLNFSYGKKKVDYTNIVPTLEDICKKAPVCHRFMQATRLYRSTETE